jgi:uncharacterized membrane protein
MALYNRGKTLRSLLALNPLICYKQSMKNNDNENRGGLADQPVSIGSAKRGSLSKWVTTGVLSALVLMMDLTGIDFIPLPFASITLLHIPVIIGAILEGPVCGCFIGLLFGVASIIKAGIIGATPIDLAFLHFPLLAIVPRVLIGLAAWGVYRLIAGKPHTVEGAAGVARELIAIVAASVAGALVNTVLVLGGLVLCVPEITVAMALLAAPNGLLEAAAAALVSLAVVSAWKRIPRHGGKAKLRKYEAK